MRFEIEKIDFKIFAIDIKQRDDQQINHQIYLKNPCNMIFLAVKNNSIVKKKFIYADFEF